MSGGYIICLIKLICIDALNILDINSDKASAL